MFSPRWRKLFRDLLVERGRAVLMMAAIAVSLVGVGSVLGAYAILTREIKVSYLGTRPASATLELESGVDANLIASVKRNPAIREAEARDVVLARARVSGDWRPLLLFVVDDFSSLKLNTFRRESGAWPPATGTMLIERTAASMLDAKEGRAVIVKTSHGAERAVPVSGVVHDPGLAPAWQEREGYGYITRATLERLGEEPVLHELRIELARGVDSAGVIEAEARALAGNLAASGHPVHEIRVPPPLQHPHQRQMTTVLVLLLAFSILALLLSAILVASSLAALLARQVREIGIMKTLGAQTGQLAGMYVALVATLGAVATLIALPVGMAGARAFSGAVAVMLNFTPSSVRLPNWVWVTQVGAGILVPLLVASVPVLRAARTTVRAALDQYGVSAGSIGPAAARLPLPLRNAVRRPARLALTLGLLAAGGAMFMTALNVSRGWQANIAKIYETRHYDVEIRLQASEPQAIATRLATVRGVRSVEAWGYSPAAFSVPNQVDVVRTYPDRSHGSLVVMAPPPATALINFPILAGRWLSVDDSDAVVLNHSALSQGKSVGAAVGSRVWLSLDGQRTSFRVVGVVEEIGAAGVAYVSNATFARLTGTGGRARLLRIVTDTSSPAAREVTIRRLEAELAAEGVNVDSVTPMAELRTAMGDHILILIRALLAMAILMAIVGALGLASAMGTSVTERTREYAVMKTLGATGSRVARVIISEALAVAGASWLFAFATSLPLSLIVDRLVGKLGFLAPLPLVVSASAAGIWLALLGVVSLLATSLPARRVARLTVREGLSVT